MVNKKSLIPALLIALAPMVSSGSVSLENNKTGVYKHPFYFGAIGGYGKTTWGQLVPEQPDFTLSLSTPIRANEGGAVWGAYLGYEIIPQFALEASYMRYPDADLEFSPLSLFAFYHDGQTDMVSHTESASLVAKLMVVIPHTCGFRAYSTFGAAGVHRFDVITNRWRLSPTFGVGFNYLATERIMFEIGTEYVAGYGQSEIEPDQHYVPFLYSGFARISYRFG